MNIHENGLNQFMPIAGCLPETEVAAFLKIASTRREKALPAVFFATQDFADDLHLMIFFLGLLFHASEVGHIVDRHQEFLDAITAADWAPFKFEYEPASSSALPAQGPW